ncbi:uncharacterized protein PFL1_03637 [Pseudozyma flocculosa PF-1]|uniref:COP9 signalosome complex subunit 6 n=1 Tax=Pseudozyma flocculosa PF-1 TaxID=1277687 RepID=A0A061H8P1_9BASI|nr:uncharacterized protein PFL1_03637 [Pseudozyma flocculosa PF-1]EPQ28834.1 hypothetical protein PFL1_03637 [Pseudozyma flocculosa PF-1]
MAATASTTGASASGSTSSALRVSPLSPVLLDAQSSSGVASNVSLHPLPILNVSEHLVRTRLQSSSDNVRVYGMLLGTQSGRDIEIQNSFEIQLAAAGGSSLEVDHDFLRSRQAQYKQVFPTLDVLGWYTVGAVPLESDMHIHKQLLVYNETPLLLQLHPTVASFEAADKDGELPINVYESVIEMVGTEATTFFIPTGYRIETGEAERIAVDHTSKAGAESGGSDESSMVASLMAQYNAIAKLQDRIKLVTAYMQQVKEAKVPMDHESLRQIKAVVSNLPATGLDDLNVELLREYNDVLLTNYLTTMTKGVHTMNELVDKFDLVQSGQAEGEFGPGGGMGPGGRGARSRPHREAGAGIRAVYS